VSVSDVAVRYALSLDGWFESKFLPKTRRDEESGCLLWTGAKSARGDGVTSVVLPSHGGGQRPMMAHRVMFAHEHGVEALPYGGPRPTYVIERTCGNLACVEPGHLRKVSSFEARNKYSRPPRLRERV
jgi:hypothetical protein